MYARLATLSVCILLALTPKPCTAGTTFNELGFLLGYEAGNAPVAMTDDGSTVVGWSINRESGRSAYIWRKDEGIAPLSDMITGAIDAVTISGDGGSIFIGRGGQVMRWTQSSGLAPLFDVPTSTDYIEFVGSSSDGSTLVGSLFANSNTPSAATRTSFHWRDGKGMSTIDNEFVAAGVSGDGGFVVGYRLLDPIINGHTNGVRRSIDDSETVVETGATFTHAIAASHDGSVVVGIAGADGFRWTDDGGTVVLGTLPGQYDATTALDVSRNGSIVVGYAEGVPEGAFIWDANHGIRSLYQILTDQGVDVSPHFLGAATFISDDGRTIVGLGAVNPSGQAAWIATIVPEPNSLLLAAFSVPVLLWRRRVSMLNANQRETNQ